MLVICTDHSNEIFIVMLLLLLFIMWGTMWKYCKSHWEKDKNQPESILNYSPMTSNIDNSNNSNNSKKRQPEQFYLSLSGKVMFAKVELCVKIKYYLKKQRRTSTGYLLQKDREVLNHLDQWSLTSSIVFTT